MLKLTIGSETQVFNKKHITIGSGNVDINIPNENLSDKHLSIINNDHTITVQNLANDPLISINGLPFAKKSVTPPADITVGRTIIKIEPVTEEINLDELLNEVEQLDKPQKTTPPPQIIIDEEEEDTAINEKYFDDFDDESEGWIAHQDDKQAETNKTSSFAQKGVLSIVILAVVILSFVIFSGVYFSITERNRLEETSVAGAVADISMALLYANNNHILPRKQNWSDAQFLKENLSYVLAPDFEPQVNVDAQGQFENLSYQLRIYMGSDHSHFLVMAQPNPTIRQWLIPKPAIIVDSQAMELRKTLNIREINRTLVALDTLDDPSEIDVSQLVKQAEIIPLSSLEERKKRNPRFTPPKALGLLNPNGENIIFNAPRYYPYTEALLHHASENSELIKNRMEIALRQQDLKTISSMDNVVLYTSEGIQKAMAAQLALSSLLPNHQVIIAYLKLTPDGKIKSSHLLTRHENQELALNTIKELPKTEETSKKEKKHTPIAPPPPPKAKIDIDNNHPLFIQLSKINHERQKTLSPLGNDLISLIQQHNHSEQINFQNNFTTLIHEYIKISEDENQKVVKGLTNLYHDYTTMPFAQFMKYVEAAGMKEQLIASTEKNDDQQLPSEDEMHNALLRIREATDFDALNEETKATTELIMLNKIPEPELLILYQNAIRYEVLQKLDQFLFSPGHRLPPSLFNEENKDLLIEILQSAWITDNNEYEFYMNEYELLTP